MKIVTPGEAVAAIPDGKLAVFPGGCADPRVFFDAFSVDIERFSALTVCSGLSWGDYRFLDRGLGRHFHYLTWQASPKIRHLFAENDRRKVSFVPIRLSDLTRVVSPNGPIRPDVAVVQTSMPQDDGKVSLGISVGPNPHFIESADIVIAEMNSNMPVTAGDSRVDIEDIDFAIESSLPLANYDTGEPEPRDERIVEHVLSLIPNAASVQFGLGAVPDRVLGRLAEISGASLYSGMLSQGLVRFLENATHTPSVINGELAGSASLYAYCDRNDVVRMAGLSVTHDPLKLAALPRFVSINSSIEIDLQGQSNGETLGPVQISGVGGSLDYIEAAALSAGGVSIIALPSTTAGGKRSKIVASLAPGSVVTTPRYCTDYVITEYGVARLRGKSLWQRAEALIEIAHPDFRGNLAGQLSSNG
jgi:4-hydroxybutyrate CoA-transferase